MALDRLPKMATRPDECQRPAQQRKVPEEAARLGPRTGDPQMKEDAICLSPMKTLTEESNEHETLRIKQRTSDTIWLIEVIAQEILLFPRPPSKASKYDRHALREAMREQVRETRSYIRLGAACDNCRTELINPYPDVVLMSNPPQYYVSCIGCGWKGSTSR